ncbi:isocitrate lyase/phosphoenolpyruvate mutase family protein [Streptomyces sp. ME03-5709C]|nr:isocitrate lyase/phosphoenolpyruvate mutase family protein [Streptomyces sp. ME03-5709C]
MGVDTGDGRPGGAGPTDPAPQSERNAAIKRSAPALFVNARADTCRLGATVKDPGPQTRRRAAAHLAAGAGGISVPGLPGEAVVAVLAADADAPLTVPLPPEGPGLPRLGEPGALRRVGTGSLLLRARTTPPCGRRGTPPAGNRSRWDGPRTRVQCRSEAYAPPAG